MRERDSGRQGQRESEQGGQIERAREKNKRERERGGAING